MQTFYTFNKHDLEPHLSIWAEKSFSWSTREGFTVEPGIHPTCRILSLRLDFAYSIRSDFFGIWLGRPTEDISTIQLAGIKFVLTKESENKTRIQIFKGATLAAQEFIHWYDSSKVFLYMYNDIEGYFNVGLYKSADRIGNMTNIRNLIKENNYVISFREIQLSKVNLLSMGSWNNKLILMEELEERAGCLLARNRKDSITPGGDYKLITGVDSEIGIINVERNPDEISTTSLEKISGLGVPLDIPFFLGQYEPYGTSGIVPCIGISKLSGANLFTEPSRIVDRPDTIGYFNFTGIPGRYPAIQDTSNARSFNTMQPLQEPKFYQFLPGRGLSIGQAEDESYPQENTKYSASFKGTSDWIDNVTVQTTFSINSEEGNQLETTTELIYIAEIFGLAVSLIPPSSTLTPEDQYGLQIETLYPTRVIKRYSFISSTLFDENRWEKVEESSSYTTYMKSITKEELTFYLLKPTNWVIQAGALAVDGSPGVRIYINDELFLEIKYHNRVPNFYTGGSLVLGRGLMDFTLWSYGIFSSIVHHRELVSGIPSIGWVSPVFSIPEGTNGKPSVFLTSILPEESAGYSILYRTSDTTPTGDPIKTIINDEITYEVSPPESWAGTSEWTHISKVTAGEEVDTPVYLQYTIRYENWKTVL